MCLLRHFLIKMDGSCELFVFFILCFGNTFCTGLCIWFRFKKLSWFLTTFFFSLGRANCVNFQKSSSLLATETEEVTIQCSHDDSNLQVMLWYLQNQSTVMVLIGYTYTATGEPQFEDGFKDRFKMNRTSTTQGHLIISKLLQSDSAVYYCTVSQHSAVYSLRHCTKTSNTLHAASVSIYLMMFHSTI